MRKLFAALLIAVAAAESALSADAAASLLPTIPPAKGEQCVEPTDIMRRQHMEFLMHQRDITVIDGIRTEKHQLTKCLNCHVQPDEAGVYPRHTDAAHFCTSCHKFTSVKIDCFECHADRPESYYQQHAQTHSRQTSRDGLLGALLGMTEK